MPEEKNTVWVRVFTAIFAGYMGFFFLHAAINSALTAFGITPYGRFVAYFYMGRTKDEAKTFIEANTALYNEMLRGALMFSNIVVTPVAGLIAGLIIGAITATAQRSGFIWTVIAAVPMALFFWGRSERDAASLVWIAVLFILMSVGGAAGDRLVRRRANRPKTIVED